MVQRRWPTWKGQRRVEHARRILYQLRAYWEWQIGHRPISHLAELHLKDLQAYQQARTEESKATSTINRTLRHLMAILRQRHEQGQAVDSSVFRLRPLPRPDSLPRYLPETEIRTLETFVRDRFDEPDPLIRLENACFFVLAHAGLRASECVDLQFQDLDLPAKRLRVRLGKGQRDRIVPLSDTAVQALRLYLGQTTPAPTALWWLKPNGQSITKGWLYTHLVALGQAAGDIALSANRLRHTLATRLLNLGLQITQIQKLLGHENINTTMIYARVLDKTLETDYHHAMHLIELQHLPFSTTPELVNNWPSPVPSEPTSVPVDYSG
jgi:site-specific recombinase XerD